MNDTEAPKRPRVRDSRLDIARGLAIAGVVIVHVYRGLYGAGMVDQSTTYLVDRLVGFWCLVVFAFVGGTLVPRGVRSRGVSVYVRDRVSRFFAVYVVWALLQGSVQLLAADSVNVPTSPLSIFAVWRPPGQLWYLTFLILVTAVFVPLQPWRRGRAPWVLSVAAVISIVFWGYDGGYVGTQGLALVVFFVAGTVCGAERVLAVLDRFKPAVAGVVGALALAAVTALGVLTVATPPTFDPEGRTVMTVAIAVVVTVVSSAAILLIGHSLRAVSLLALVGQRSLDIYLAHVIMAAGTRIVLGQFGVTSLWIYVPAGFLMGMVGSLIAGSVARRIKLGWVFDGPSWLSRLATARYLNRPRSSSPD